MKPCVLAMSSHGRMAMPTSDAMTPPAAKLMRCGARLTRALATGTTLAAMLVLRVARMSPAAEAVTVTSAAWSAAQLSSMSNNAGDDAHR